MEFTTLMDDSPFVRELAGNPKLERFNWGDRWGTDPEVRKGEGRIGFSYVSDFPKHGHVMYWEEDTRQMHGAVYFSVLAEGPPGCAHGGSIAASFDHILGAFVFRACGVSYHTVHLEVDYKLFIKLNTTVRFVAEIVKEEGRKVFVKCTMVGEEGKEHAVSTGIFLRSKGVSLDYQTIQESMKHLKRDQYLAILKSRL